MSTNLAELPWLTTQTLSRYLDLNDVWKTVLYAIDHSQASAEESRVLSRGGGRPTESLLLQLGNRGFTVLHLLTAFDSLRLEKPQLALHRKFKAVRFVKQPSLTEDVDGVLGIHCEAAAFPYPRYQWFKDALQIEGADKNSFAISRCHCGAQSGVYTCRIWNEISEGEEWSAFYRKAGKQFTSDLNSQPIRVETASESESCVCGLCATEEALARVLSLVNDNQPAGPDAAAAAACQDEADDRCFAATDKVALIVSNSEYAHLSRLLTPPCDAETLCAALLLHGFKTVTLADLGLEQMRRVITVYRQLLGEGVYAVFYFVGHGFEANGRCYLLPVDAPPCAEYAPSDCLCVDWVLSLMQQTRPALNLMLLDICRKYPPTNVQLFSQEAAQYEYRVNRNTVFGYATSFGVGAYEVRGETNGVFMKHLKQYLGMRKPVIDVLNLVLADLENDPKASQVQFPELRTNLSRPLSLADPLIADGHTVSFDHRTLQWQHIHELPEPSRVLFGEQQLRVTIWFDFVGHFTNIVYAFTSVADASCEHAEDAPRDQTHLAYLHFAPEVAAVQTTVCSDDEEGVSVRTLIKNLQTITPPLTATIQLFDRQLSKVVAETHVNLGRVLIMSLDTEYDTEEGV